MLWLVDGMGGKKGTAGARGDGGGGGQPTADVSALPTAITKLL